MFGRPSITHKIAVASNSEKDRRYKELNDLIARYESFLVSIIQHLMNIETGYTFIYSLKKSQGLFYLMLSIHEAGSDRPQTFVFSVSMVLSIKVVSVGFADGGGVKRLLQ